LEDKVDILRKVIIEKEPHSWVAKEYRKSPASISKLLQQFKRHPELLREGLNKHQDARTLRATVSDFVSDLNEKDAFIRSVQDIIHLLQDEKHIQVSVSLVQSVMREDLGMRYRKVREVAPQ
jgi:transposase